MRGLGQKVKEQRIVEKLLRAVPMKFFPIASNLEQFGNLSTMSLEEAVGALKNYEVRLRGYDASTEEQVLLTRAEWKTKAQREVSLVSVGVGVGAAECEVMAMVVRGTKV